MNPRAMPQEERSRLEELEAENQEQGNGIPEQQSILQYGEWKVKEPEWTKSGLQEAIVRFVTETDQVS